MDLQLDTLRAPFRQLCRETLLPRFAHVTRQTKADGSVVSEADRAMQAAMNTWLHRLTPDIPVLGEEMPRAAQQALLDRHTRFWCLDPIDGSSNFVSSLPFFAVSLALIGPEQTEIGLVYDPMRDELFSAQQQHGAWLNAEPLACQASAQALDACLALVDLKRLPQSLANALVQQRPFGSHRTFGSTALELCWLAAGRAQLYLRGEQHLWDDAAAALILQQAGGVVQRLNKEAIVQAELSAHNCIAAVSPDVFDSWAAVVAQLL